MVIVVTMANKIDGKDCPKERQKLVLDIQQVFPVVPYPAGNIAWGDPNQSDEYRYANELFHKRHWNAISIEELLAYPSGISATVTFLDDAAFLYYLPLFMQVVVERFADCDLLSDSLLCELTPNSEVVDAGFIMRFQGLTAEQKSCVTWFLQYLAECEVDGFSRVGAEAPPAVALGRYWRQFAR